MSEYNTNQDGQWKTSEQWRAEEANDHSNPKKNKNGGRGKYVAKLAASAVAFGLIAGLVMQGQPIYDAYQSLLPKAEHARVVFMTPQGRPFTQRVAEELAQEENLVFLCGHYEGIDERVIEEIVTDEISLGDFVLTGGELAAITIIDAVSRLVPGVLGKEESFEDESFSEGLLEYPQYTRPPVFMGREVPEVLLSGHHGNVAKWRREQALIRTAKKRPDLLKKAVLTKQDIAFLQKQGITIEETE